MGSFAIIRVLSILLCLVPFTSARQVSGALAPYIPQTPLTPADEAPPPASEEDDERESNDKEQLTAQTRYRAPIRQRIGLLPRPRSVQVRFLPQFSITSPFDDDPFRNGLGSPYHC